MARVWNRFFSEILHASPDYPKRAGKSFLGAFRTKLGALRPPAHAAGGVSCRRRRAGGLHLVDTVILYVYVRNIAIESILNEHRFFPPPADFAPQMLM